MRDALSESLYTLLFDLNRQWSQPQVNILQVIKNEFLHNLKTDHIAVDHTGTPIARAADRAAVERAAPNAAAYFSGADFSATTEASTIPEQPDYSATDPRHTPTQTAQMDANTAPPVREWSTGVVAAVKTEPVSLPPATAPVNIPPTTQAHAPDPNLPTDPYPTYVPAASNNYQNQQGVDAPGAEQTAANAQLADEPPATGPAKLN